MVSSEAAPFAKTGGLADVLGALPQELARQGEECAVVLPRYGNIPLTNATKVYSGLQVWLGSTVYLCDVWLIVHLNVQYFFLDQASLYDRHSLYGFGDDHIRFAVLSLGALGVARHLFRPDVIHSHDWHGSLTPLYLKNYFPNDPTFAGIKTLFTIHNLYDCQIGNHQLGEIGLDGRYFRSDLLEFYGSVSILKAGLVYADQLSAVSPGYAREIQTSEYGFGYEGLLRARSHQLTGILNGVDYREWNPETDTNIAAHYSANDLSGKRKCKAALLEQFGFPAEKVIDRPLIGVISRLADQKGFQLIEQVFHEFCSLDITFILLGSGEYRFETMFWHMEQFHREKMRTYLGYSTRIAHQIEAGADMFLMPSRYEPCGLNQIYSLRYGTLPIVRATGGLNDTIDDETGFKFWGFSGAEMLLAIHHALKAYQDQAGWTRMMKTAMQRDFSWRIAAGEYKALYRRL